MRPKQKIIAGVILLGVVIAALVWYLSSHSIDVLSPAGPINSRERQLILVALLLSVIVVVPVYIMTVAFAWRYRASNMAAKYQPDWDHSRLLESIWWGIPCAIILVLSIITWNSSHSLDPFKPLSYKQAPMVVQVVALDWKWLFIYPSQHVASVNEVNLPINQPIVFDITSDTVMNSFWVPRLGGQIYAMPGMSTELHLLADRPGSFYGSSANISGKGFAGMKFTARAINHAAFNSWVGYVKQNAPPLSLNSYNRLAQPSENLPVSYYANPSDGLYDSIVMKYMLPGGKS